MLGISPHHPTVVFPCCGVLLCFMGREGRSKISQVHLGRSGLWDSGSALSMHITRVVMRLVEVIFVQEGCKSHGDVRCGAARMPA